MFRDSNISIGQCWAASGCQIAEYDSISMINGTCYCLGKRDKRLIFFCFSFYFILFFCLFSSSFLHNSHQLPPQLPHFSFFFFFYSIFSLTRLIFHFFILFFYFLSPFSFLTPMTHANCLPQSPSPPIPISFFFFFFLNKEMEKKRFEYYIYIYIYIYITFIYILFFWRNYYLYYYCR